MSEITMDEIEFKSDLFCAEPYGDEGEADGLLTLDEVGIDSELQHQNWQAEKAGRHLLGLELETEGIASYGYLVYRDLLEEAELKEAVYLDPRCFLRDTSLLDVLEAAANTAIDYDHKHLVAPIVKGMIHTSQLGNSAGETMRKYLPTVMRSVDTDAIRAYVDFMNNNTVKGPEESKVFLKQMAHSVQALPEKGLHPDDKGIRRLEKQILLEDIGHAWIRKAMPVAEIDWLP